MAGTIKTVSELFDAMPLGVENGTSAQDIHDLIVSVLGGFGAYEDVTTKTLINRLVGTGGVRFPYECDGAGSNSESGFLPYPKVPIVDELWDDTNHRILLANLPAGQRMAFRMNFTIDPASPNSSVEAFAKVHNSSDVFFFELEKTVTELKSTGDKTLVADFRFYIGAGLTDGYVYPELLCSSDCTVEVGGIYIEVFR